jgi:hypothetical protein
MARRKLTALPATPPRSAIERSAVAHGRKRAADAAKRRRQRLRRGAMPGANGVLVAEGDSWFNYPFHDVLSMLEDDFSFRVESVAHLGDTLESMTYDETQLEAFGRKLEHLKDDSRAPRAILLSAGGNDMAGDEFALLLNHAASGMPPLNAKIVDGLINDRLRFEMISLLMAMTGLCQDYFGTTIPIVVHGYGNAVPDGRGVLGGFSILPGPWLEPAFRQKGYTQLVKNVPVMKDLIGYFNDMLADLPAVSGLSHVSYLDLRSLLSNQLLGNAYKKSWANELHPTPNGFAVLAKAFSDRILTL